MARLAHKIRYLHTTIGFKAKKKSCLIDACDLCILQTSQILEVNEN